MKRIRKIICVLVLVILIVSVSSLQAVSVKAQENTNSNVKLEIEKIGVTIGGWWIYLDTYLYCSIKNYGEEAVVTSIRFNFGPLLPPGIVNIDKGFGFKVESGETERIYLYKTDQLHAPEGLYYVRIVLDPYNNQESYNVMTRIFYIKGNWVIPLITISSPLSLFN